MKKIILSGLLVLGGLTTNAQLYDYSVTTGWSANIRTLYTNPMGCGLSPLSTLTGAGTITIGSGLLNFNAVKGAHENRISVNTGSMYDQQFNIDFDLNVTSTASGKGILPVALTSLDLNPMFKIPMTVCSQANNMDMLAVGLSTPSVSSNIAPQLIVVLFDNAVQLSTPGAVNIAYATTYYCRVQIHSNEHGELQVFSNSTRTTLVGSFCFDIPATVNSLRFLQHSTNSAASGTRVASGWVDNTNIYHAEDNCCDIDVKGTNIISGASTDAFFDVSTTGTSVMASISPAGVTYTQALNGDITVTDWGTLTDTPKVVTITVTAICQCEEITTKQIVYVYPTGLPLAPQHGTPPVMINPEEHKTGRIFPNPTTGMITIENEVVMTSVILSDSNGKVLETLNKNAERATVDLSSRPAGLYFIRMITENGEQLEQVVKK